MFEPLVHYYFFLLKSQICSNGDNTTFYTVLKVVCALGTMYALQCYFSPFTILNLQ